MRSVCWWACDIKCSDIRLESFIIIDFSMYSALQIAASDSLSLAECYQLVLIEV
jgi:hypothetical protein